MPNRDAKTWEKMTRPEPRRRLRSLDRVDWAIVGAVAALVVFIAFVVGICLYKAANHLDAGTLVDKWHKAAHTYHTTTFIKSGSVRIPVRRTHHNPEQWLFIVSADGKTDTWSVSEDQYNSAEVGEWVERRH